MAEIQLAEMSTLEPAELVEQPLVVELTFQ
jgi:hypothetical protein